MKKILIIAFLLLCSVPYTTQAAITFVASSTIIQTGYAGGPVTATTTLAPNVGDLVVLTAHLWQDTPGTGSLSAATFNGGTMSRIINSRSVGTQCEMWYIVSTTTGSKTVSTTVSGATDAIKIGVSAYTGTSATPFEATSTTLSTGGDPTNSITTSNANDLVVSFLNRFGTTDAATNKTNVYKERAASTLMAASTIQTTTAGAYTDTYTGTSAADWCMGSAAFKAAATLSIFSKPYLIWGEW